jgi:antitoxin Phd
MTEMSLTEARSRLADVVDTARVDHAPVFLTRRGRQVAAVIDAEDLRRLMEAAEDLADLQALRAAREEAAESGDPSVSLDELKAELGMA